MVIDRTKYGYAERCLSADAGRTEVPGCSISARMPVLHERHESDIMRLRPSVLSPARSVAFEVLRQVERGGYAADLLFTLSTGLDSRDAGLASEIARSAVPRASRQESPYGRGHRSSDKLAGR
jgi:hypothetical protein